MSVRGDYGKATNIVIRNNYLDTIGGDGIVVTSSIKALVEYNVAKNCHNESGCYAGMWTISAIDTVFQYNEGYLIKTIDDGMAYDCDAACEGTIFQYNYSHDNEGGFMLIINNDVTKYPWANNEDNTIRYNISQNDKNIIFQFSSKNFNTKIYNNVIYLGKDSKTKIVYHGSYANIYNNIFYNLGSGGFDYDETVDFDYNCYYGSDMPGQPVEKHGIYADPQLVAPGTGAIGINTLNGYRLKPTSPCINAGKVIENNGGKDFFSNPVPFGNSAPDIGACEYQRDAQDMETMNADFNKSTLDKGWKFIREDKNSWNLTEKSGYLKLNGENGDLAGQTNNMKNILVKSAPEYDYILTAKLDCKPLEQGQSAGLIIYGDDDNYISLTREFNALGGIYTLKGDIDGKNKSFGLIKDKISSGEVYLKIFREGTSYKAYYSSDNNNWIYVGIVTSSEFANGKIGLFAAKTNEAAKDFTAAFDYLHCDEYKVDIRTIEDDFDVDYLDGRWSFVKEDSSRWSLKDRPGYMRIKATPGTINGIWDNNIKNILLTQSPVSDFEVITKMDFRPLANGQEAGIIVYSDDDNYLTLSRSVDTSSKTYRRYVMKSEINGEVNEFAANADVSCKMTMYFKLVKQGDTYTGYVKTEPSSWVYVGKFNNTNLSNFKVGLFATKGYRSTADINADFDYFMYKPVVK